MPTAKEIADALLAAPHLTDEVMQPMQEYRAAKRRTGAPVALENAVLHAARECEHTAATLRETLATTAKRATEALAAATEHGTKTSDWSIPEPREQPAAIAKRMRMQREQFNALVDAWESVAERIAATPEEIGAVAAQREAAAKEKRDAEIAAWCKRSKADLMHAAGVNNIPAIGTKEDIAAALVDAGHRP